MTLCGGGGVVLVVVEVVGAGAVLFVVVVGAGVALVGAVARAFPPDARVVAPLAGFGHTFTRTTLRPWRRRTYLHFGRLGGCLARCTFGWAALRSAVAPLSGATTMLNTQAETAIAMRARMRRAPG
jgi:hypothetical protein